jgi:hypothetical protein
MKISKKDKIKYEKEEKSHKTKIDKENKKHEATHEEEMDKAYIMGKKSCKKNKKKR